MINNQFKADEPENFAFLRIDKTLHSDYNNCKYGETVWEGLSARLKFFPVRERLVCECTDEEHDMCRWCVQK